MKMHPSVVEQIMKIYEMYGGYTDNRRLIKALSAIDLTPYERKTTANQEVVLVLTEDFMKKLSQKR